MNRLDRAQVLHNAIRDIAHAQARITGRLHDLESSEANTFTGSLWQMQVEAELSEAQRHLSIALGVLRMLS